MNLIAKVIHGSHLYGLNTPESDMDYKGIYIPSMEDMILGNVKDSINLSSNKSNEKNTSSDVDYEVYSLQKFMKLLSKGEMVAFDMLFAPDELIEYYDKYGQIMTNPKTNPFYQIRQNYHLFIHSDMKAYLGYCRKQAAKYGIKGSRLSDLRKVVEVVDELFERGVLSSDRLEQYVDQLPTTEHCYREGQVYVVLGKQHQLTTNIYEFHDRIHDAFKKYGDRAHRAEQNDGVDWKAVSHAFRAGYQLLDLFQFGKMILPLNESRKKLILSIKLGERNWVDVKQDLEDLLDRVENEANRSDLQKYPDYDKIDQFTLNLISKTLL